MSKSLIGIIGVLVVLLLWGVSTYNGLIGCDEGVKKAWGNVETQYQRRADLIPNLVETVKGYAKHENETFENVTNARAKAASINLSIDNLTEENIQKFQKAQQELSQGIGKLIATAENYPELKANQNFLELQAQLEGTENRIAVARKDYNEEVESYNKTIRSFPKNIIAGFMSLSVKPYIKSEEGAEKAPSVKF